MREFIFGALTIITFFSLGINLIVFKTAKNKSDHYQQFITNESEDFIIEVVEIPKEKPNSVQIIAQIKSVKTTENKWDQTNGNAIFYFAKDSNSLRILQGDELVVQSNLNDIKPAQNPGQFNYKQYLSFNQIYQQGFVDHQSWTKLSSSSGSITSFASKIRDELLNILKSNGLTGEELGVASALILGYKDDLDPDLKHSYSSAGATHVLAVSGLHVGIIFLAVNFLIGIFDKSEKRKYLRLIILLATLWFYALITGLSPSVVRAATMFSFVAVGKATGRQSYIYNTLAGSALLLLVINPYLIMEVGFQLSYLAVLGIVYFQKLIYQRLHFKNRIANYIWNISSVSIAAQLTTFPLGLLYFHQFPSYFLISNLIVIPGAVIIISIGISVFLTSWIPFIGFGLAKCLEAVIYGMNWVVKSIDSLPFALIEGISISILECWLIYLIIVHIVMTREFRKSLYFKIALLLSTVFIVIDLVEDEHLRTHKELVIYDIKNEISINFISNKNNILIANESLSNNESSLLFNIKHHWYDLDLNYPSTFSPDSEINLIDLKSKNGLYLFGDLTLYNFDHTIQPDSLSIDILLINNTEYQSLHELLDHINVKEIILGNVANRKYFYELTDLHDVNFHDIITEGAYIKSF